MQQAYGSNNQKKTKENALSYEQKKRSSVWLERFFIKVLSKLLFIGSFELPHQVKRKTSFPVGPF